MPITYTIDKQRRFIQRVLSETVTTDEILANITEILDHPDYQLGMKSLTDLQALQHHATPQDVRQIAHFILGHGEQVQGGQGGGCGRGGCRLWNGADAGVAYRRLAARHRCIQKS